MSEETLDRRRLLGTDKVYTEADFAIYKDQLERDFKDRSLAQELARLQGQFASLPEQMRTIAKSVAMEVITAQKQEASNTLQKRFTWLNDVGTLVQGVVALYLLLHAMRLIP